MTLCVTKENGKTQYSRYEKGIEWNIELQRELCELLGTDNVKITEK